MKKILAVILAAMLLISVFAGCGASESTKATEVPSEASEVALVIGETEFTVADMDYMYVSTFYEVYNNLSYTYYSYGMDISTILDITKPLEEQMVSESQTWHDYILEQTLSNLKEIVGICERAEAEGYTLSEKEQNDVATLDQQLVDIATENGYSDPLEYLALLYGKTVGIENVKKMTELQILASSFVNYYNEGIEVTEEDITAYYEANKKDIDTVSMRYFFTEIYSDAEGSEYTSEQAKADAEALAATETAEEFDALVYELADEETKAALDEGTKPFISGMSYNSVGYEEVSEWLFDEATEIGATFVYHDAESASYLTVRLEERIDPDYNYIDVRHILIMPEEDAEGNVTDEAWSAAEAKATEVLNEYLAGEMTEEAFGELAATYSADGNAAQGGIYENVYRGQMVEPFESWCYDEARAIGDTGIVKTQYGYHVMYFVGLGDNNLIATIEPTVKEEKLATWAADCLVNVTAEPTDSYAKVGGMIDDIVAANAEATPSTETETKEPAKKLSFTEILIVVLVAIIIVCIIIIIKNGKNSKKVEPMAEAEELEGTEENELPEATDEDLTEEEILAEEAFEEVEEVTEEEESSEE